MATLKNITVRGCRRNHNNTYLLATVELVLHMNARSTLTYPEFNSNVSREKVWANRFREQLDKLHDGGKSSMPRKSESANLGGIRLSLTLYLRPQRLAEGSLYTPSSLALRETLTYVGRSACDHVAAGL